METPKVATIGFFDGVHLGHNYLLDQLKTEAHARGMQSMVITFANHPRLYFNPNCGLRQLTLTDEKVHLLQSKGIDHVVVKHFDAALSQKTSQEFMRMLVEEHHVALLLMGHDHRFGSDKESNIEQYISYGAQIGLEVKRCKGYISSDVMVSSSKVRKALEFWDIPLANQLLGYPYSIRGVVVPGAQIGRQLGYPTANLSISSLKHLPSDGVYGVEVDLRGTTYRGVLNIGSRPTVSGASKSVEVHLLGYQGDLYSEELTVRFHKFLRHEQKFSSLTDLKNQIARDIEMWK